MTEMSYLNLQRNVREHEEEIARLRSLLLQNNINQDAQVKSVHRGEFPRVERRAVETPPPQPVMKSIVYQMPRQRPVSGEKRPLGNIMRRRSQEPDRENMFRPDRSRH